MKLHRSSNGDIFLSNPTISWDSVPCPNGSDVVNYIFKTTRGDGDLEETVAVEGTSVNPTLSPCTVYSFQVAAQTSKGIGDYSYIQMFETPTKGNYKFLLLTKTHSHEQLWNFILVGARPLFLSKGYFP